MSRREIRGKVVIVTGASGGIGKATSLALAREGARLVLAARSEAALAEVSAQASELGAEVLVVRTDVTRREDAEGLVRAAMERFGQVDVFVGCAGVYLRKPAVDLEPADFERMLAVNFYGSLYGIYAVLPHMLERRQGSIVVVTSMDGRKGIPPDGAYVASKFALTGLLEVLRQELLGTGVRVSTVLPARIDTPMLASVEVSAISAKVPPEQVARGIVDAIRTGRGEVLVPYFGPKLLLLLNAISTDLGDWAVRLFNLPGEDVQPSEAKSRGTAPR